MGFVFETNEKGGQRKVTCGLDGRYRELEKKKEKSLFQRRPRHVTSHRTLSLAPLFKLQVCGQIMTFTGKTRRKRQRRSDPSDETDFLQADTPDSALAAIDQLIRRFNLDPSMFKFKDDDPGPCLSLSLFRLGVLLC